MGRGERLLRELAASIEHFLPDLKEKLSEIPDMRVKSDYDMVEIVFAAIMMFVFKEGSRNAFNNDRSEGEFAANYWRAFKLALPHMDTVDAVMRVIEIGNLDEIRIALIRELIESKIFAKFRHGNAYYRIAFDGTGVVYVNEGHCDHCLKQKRPSGKVLHFHNVLEAKLICPNGFAISLMSEWIENEPDYVKQDCEQRAFARLAARLKQAFPRLPICVVADGLYPNATIFSLLRQYNWRYVITLQDDSLPSVWEEVSLSQSFKNTTIKMAGAKLKQELTWVNSINYHDMFSISWVECIESTINCDTQKTSRFVYITDIPVDHNSASEVVETGRMRQNIEDSFNSQKNRGYAMKHKYSRISLTALKNYYAAMQIAHLINQLVELGSLIKPILTAKLTLKHLWKQLLQVMTHAVIEWSEAPRAKRLHVRFE